MTVAYSSPIMYDGYDPRRDFQHIQSRCGDVNFDFRKTFETRPSTSRHDAIGFNGSDYAYARAPMLQTRDVPIPGRMPRAKSIYLTPTEPGPGLDAVNLAFSRWYAAFVFKVLVAPGQYRRGVGGASTELWGARAREKESWLRIGWHAPGSVAPWEVIDRDFDCHSRPRYTATERYDPYNLLFGVHPESALAPLTDFVHNMVKRMSISPSSMVHAAWFVAGLGLHEGDGQKGAELRKHLVEWYWFENDRHAIEKRVAMLGLLLAGKWLDDNSFASRSYLEVTGISIMHIDRLERLALHDLHYSLYVPPQLWVDHVTDICSILMAQDEALDDMDSIVLTLVDQMKREALDACSSSPQITSSAQTSTFLEQYISPESSPCTRQLLLQSWQAYDLSEPVRGRSEIDSPDAQEDYEEWLDYDGAKQWLPPVSDMRRSISNSSEEAGRLHVAADFGMVRSSHDSMTSLPRTPGPVFASRAVSPDVFVCRQRSSISPCPGSSPSSEDRGLTMSRSFSREQRAWPPISNSVKPLANYPAYAAPSYGASTMYQTQPYGTLPQGLPGTTYREPQQRDRFYQPEQSYGRNERYPEMRSSFADGDAAGYAPYRDPMPNRSIVESRPLIYPSLPIHALLGPDAPYPGYPINDYRPSATYVPY